MKYAIATTTSMCKLAAALLVFTCLLSACAEFEQLTKPRVEGLQHAPSFDNASLVEGGFSEIHVQSSLTDKKININAYETMLIAAIREKRRDVTVSQDGRYTVTANIIANDVTQRADNLESHIYKWSKRRVKVSYVVTETATQEQVWSGIIETYREELASYESDKEQKKSDKVIDAVVAVINKKDIYPYPSPPLLSDIAKLNFEGFALNLPRAK